MNSYSLTSVDEQSLHDPLFVDWLLQNQQQLPSLNQLPGAGKYPASSFPRTTTGTNSDGHGGVLLLNPSSRGVLPPPVDNSGFQTLEPKNPQPLFEHYKSDELNQNFKPIKVNYLNGGIPKDEASERPLDLSSHSSNMGAPKPERKVREHEHQQQPHQKNHSDIPRPLRGGTETIPQATKTHFTGYCLLPAVSHPMLFSAYNNNWSLPFPRPHLPASSFFPSIGAAENTDSSPSGYSTPPYSSSHSTPSVIWVPFAIGNQTLPAPTIFSNNTETSPDQMQKMVPAYPPLHFFQGRNGEPSMGGKWPKNLRPISHNFCSSTLSPDSPSPRKHSTSSSSSPSSAFSPSPSSTSTSILVRRRLRAMLLKNRS